MIRLCEERSVTVTTITVIDGSVTAAVWLLMVVTGTFRTVVLVVVVVVALTRTVAISTHTQGSSKLR